MPTYEYLCKNCSKKHSLTIRSIKNHREKIDCSCGKQAEQILSANSLILDIKPFVTEHITGEPLLVKSRRHKKELLKRCSLIEAG